MTKPILAVGQPMTPDPDRFSALCAEIFTSGWYSNGGQLHSRFENALTARLGVNAQSGALTLTSSGTMALMMALHLGNLPQGAEVITTPLSFPATAQAIAWCGFTPVFADVDPDRLTLCPKAVERAITPRTAAILGVHLTGIPCDTEGLEAISRKHKLWLAYDGAQSPDIQLPGGPLWRKGDVTALSLHATKLLHTCEGGIVITPDNRHKPRLSRMRNFGMQNDSPKTRGTNGKMSELHAAMGLALLPDLDAEMEHRRELRAHYDAALNDHPDIKLHSFPDLASASLLYYAVRIPADRRNAARAALLSKGILSRPGFPLLCGPNTVFSNSEIHSAEAHPVALKVGQEVLCLPLHSKVSPADTKRIAKTLKSTI